MDRSSAPSKEGPLLKNVQRPQKWGGWISSNLTYHWWVSQKIKVKLLLNKFRQKECSYQRRSFLEKYSETPKMGIQIRSKLLICFNLTKILNYAFSTERVLSWKIIGNINCFAYLEVQIRLYCLKRVPKKFCPKILEVRFLRLVLLLNIAPICNV